MAVEREGTKLDSDKSTSTLVSVKSFPKNLERRAGEGVIRPDLSAPPPNPEPGTRQAVEVVVLPVAVVLVSRHDHNARGIWRETEFIAQRYTCDKTKNRPTVILNLLFWRKKIEWLTENFTVFEQMFDLPMCVDVVCDRKVWETLTFEFKLTISRCSLGYSAVQCRP